ncbi:excitatory amino acid transporter 1-like [Notothenia coriiceps]|uniref:Amino acid transporter n=1 Tax=Notothenia coriiceps TaxID=8208 RepID=A0A6I9NIM1_9TELE|nr:PREDICTED: excitatory amino acid transporter 1-like [Notothenia coriiceps]
MSEQDGTHRPPAKPPSSREVSRRIQAPETFTSPPSWVITFGSEGRYPGRNHELRDQCLGKLGDLERRDFRDSTTNRTEAGFSQARLADDSHVRFNSMAALDGRASGKMGMRAVVYYTTTTVIAVFIGIVMVLIIHPGQGSKDEFTNQQKIEQISPADAFLDLIRNMFPPNLVEACTKQFKTQYAKRIVHVKMTVNDTIFKLNGSEMTREEMIPVPAAVNGVNALGLVVFSICFGLIISSMGEQGRPLKDFFDCLNEAIMRLVAIIMWYAPIGILFLIAGKIVEMDDISSMGGQLAMYTVTVMCGLLVHALFVLPTLYFLVTRKNPFVFIGGLLQALITALGTSSSSATLPITFKCLEENNKVDKRVTRFVLPVGATINMDGTALYEALAAIFIAQVNNYNLDFGQILTIR